jgi:outer membrane biosynthesis protein TonB
MTLAAILEVCLLMTSPSGSPFALPALRVLQTTAPQQDTAPATPQQPAKEPAKETAPSQEPGQTPPPASPAPSPGVQPDQTPAQQTTPVPPPENPKPAPAAQKPKTPAARRKHGPSAANKKKKPPAVGQARPKVVVKNGGATDPAVKISPTLSQQQASSQRQSSAQLTNDTDANLKKISGRQLTTSQQDTVKQIQQYMQEAKTAGDAGDLEREHNLALKAHLLSEELVKH